MQNPVRSLKLSELAEQYELRFKGDGDTLIDGIGTLSEMALAWSYLQVGEISPRPLALLGNLWRETVSGFVNPLYVRPEHIQLLHFAESPQEAVEYVANHDANDQEKG